MSWLDFSSNSVAANLLLFAVCSVIVWIAGTRVAGWADRFALASGISHATIGLVLLAGITSLPEISVSLTASASGSPALALNNLLGSTAVQVALLAVADALVGREALTVVSGTQVVLMQVSFNLLLLVVFAAAVTTGDLPLLGAGAWSWGLLVLYALSIWTISKAGDKQLWVAKRTRLQQERAEERRTAAAAYAPGQEAVAPLAWKLTAGGVVILAAGFLLSRSGDALAIQTGLGQSFMGAVFIALSTSLPEVSVLLAAVRLRRYEMAISDIFGTNLFNMALVFLVDLVHRGPPVLDGAGEFSLFAALLGAVLSGVYLVGLLERRDRTIARMGIDSFVVLVLYAGGIWLLYGLR